MGRKCLDLCVYTLWVDAVVLWGSRAQTLIHTKQSHSQTIRKPKKKRKNSVLCVFRLRFAHS